MIDEEALGDEAVRHSGSLYFYMQRRVCLHFFDGPERLGDSRDFRPECNRALAACRYCMV